MEIQVKVIKVLETQCFTSQKTGNQYVKNCFIGETAGQYPKTIAFSVMGEEKFAQMAIVVGGTYNVSFDVESREWNGKYFTECNAWRTQRIDGVQQPAQQAATTQAPVAQPTQQPQAQPANDGGGGDDNLPF